MGYFPEGRIRDDFRRTEPGTFFTRPEPEEVNGRKEKILAWETGV